MLSPLQSFSQLLITDPFLSSYGHDITAVVNGNPRDGITRVTDIRGDSGPSSSSTSSG